MNAEIFSVESEKEHWDVVFDECISNFLNTPRDVARILNTFAFKYALLQQETNWIDLLALTTLQVFAPASYDWIFNNLDQLTGSSRIIGTTGNDQEKNKSRYLEELKGVYRDPSAILQALQNLFPKFAFDTGCYSYECASDDDLLHYRRISSPDKAAMYFSLSLASVTITTETIKKSIKEYDEKELHRFINNSIENNTIRYYLKDLNCFVDDIQDDRLFIFLKELFLLQASGKLKDDGQIFQIHSSYYVVISCHKILLKMGKGKASYSLMSLIKDANDNDPLFCILVGTTIEIEKAYGKIGNDMCDGWCTISEESLANIEIVCIQKLRALAKEKNILDIRYNTYLIQFWRYMDETSLNTYLNKLFDSPENIPKALASVATHWVGTDENRWTFEKSKVESLIPAKKAYEQILSLKGTPAFVSLSEEQREIAVAYCQSYICKSDNFAEISADDVHALLSEWEALRDDSTIT